MDLVSTVVPLVVWHLVGLRLVVLAGLRLACVVGVYFVFLAFAVAVRPVFFGDLRLVFVVERVELRRLVLLLLVGSPLLLLVCRTLCVLEVDSEDELDGDGDDLQLVDAQQVAVARRAGTCSSWGLASCRSWPILRLT